MNTDSQAPIAGLMKAFVTIALAGILAAPGTIFTDSSASVVTLARQPAPPEVRGEFVLLRHGDTLRVERFTISDRVAQIEVLNADGERAEYTAWLDAGGGVDSLLFRGIDGDHRWSERSVFGNLSIEVTSTSGRGVVTHKTAKTSARAMPYDGASLALLQVLMRRAALAPGQSTRTVLTATGPSVRTITLSRVGDTLVVAATRLPSVFLALSADGTMRGGRTVEGDLIVRRPLSVALPLSSAPALTGWVDLRNDSTHLWLVAARALRFDSLRGPNPVFYSAGKHRDHAMRLEVRLREASQFFKDSLGAAAPFSVIIADKPDWSTMFQPEFYGFASNRGSKAGPPWVILQPANGEGPLAELIARAKAVAPRDLWRKLDTTGATPEALSLRLIDLVVVHEYGHVLAVRSGEARIKWGTNWFQEFVASYLMYAFLRSKHPDEADYYDAWDQLVLYEAKNPLTRVAQWDTEPELSAHQRLWYYAATGDRVRKCYARSGLNLIREYQRTLAGTPRMHLPESELLPILEQSCPGFQQWAQDMRSDRRMEGR